jgi:tetratricopeptide (TPR) repeat protein
MADFSRAIELDAANPVPYYNRAVTYAKEGELDRALSDLDRAIALDSSHVPEAYRLRATIFFNREQYGRALPEFNRLIELMPKDAVASCQRGLTLGFLKGYDDAARDLNASIRLDPTNECVRSIQQIGEKIENRKI